MTEPGRPSGEDRSAPPTGARTIEAVDDTAPVAPWADAVVAAALLAIDPPALGGLVLRAAAGPVRDRWLELLSTFLGPAQPPLKMPAYIRDDRLLGGLDLAATLRAGRPVAEHGLLARAHGRVLVVPMAERMEAGTCARLTAVLDRGQLHLERDGLALQLPARLAVVALDEGDADEHAPPALAERLALWLDLSALSARAAVDGLGLDAEDIVQARRRLPAVRHDDAVVSALCGVAAQLGIDSLRAPLLALAAARAHAALFGRDTVEHDDAVAAARLVLAPRATVLPPPAQEEQAPPEAPSTPPPADDAPDPPPMPRADEPLEDQVLQAAMAALPAGLLARLQAAKAARDRRRGGAGKAGQWQKGRLRGRPAGAMPGDPRGGRRLDLVATLRAAAPWQRLRASGVAGGPKVRVHAQDFHVTRLRQRRETTTIFVVDASGSSALHRLAEAKGAVELLLADCYVRRDRVAVLAFRGRGAELLLPPTRSLVRAKRSLAGLPGGGGTPLAAALHAATDLATALKRQGQTPVLVFLTDGRANVALNGQGGRELAQSDALTAARRLGVEALQVLLLDTAPQPQRQAALLAAEMGASYLPLPHGGAAEVSAVVQAGVAPGMGGPRWR